MGIVNVSAVGGPGPLPGFITPHGDRKPEALRAIREQVYGSLPLMGIVNLEPGADPGRHPELITPHGDRKPPSHVRRRQILLTHYPSWGS